MEVERLQGGIGALGGGMSAPLQAALRSARAKSKVIPVNERIEACKSFIERKDGSRDCQSPRTESNFRDRIAGWRSTVGTVAIFVRGAAGSPVGPSVVELQRRIDQLVQENDEWTDGVPPNLQESLSHSGRPTGFGSIVAVIANCGVLGDAATMARVGGLVAQGSAKMATFAQDVPTHGQGKSSMMAALIDHSVPTVTPITPTQWYRERNVPGEDAHSGISLGGVVATAMDLEDIESAVSNNSLTAALECDLVAHAVSETRCTVRSRWRRFAQIVTKGEVNLE